MELELGHNFLILRSGPLTCEVGQYFFRYLHRMPRFFTLLPAFNEVIFIVIFYGEKTYFGPLSLVKKFELTNRFLMIMFAGL